MSSFSPFGEMEALAASLADKPITTPVVLLDATFRGIGQILFVNNPASGFVIFLGMLLSHGETGVYGLLGALAGTVGGIMLGADDGAIRKGLYGFNGSLVGCAIANYDAGSTGDSGVGGIIESIVATTIFGIFSSVLCVNVTKWFDASQLPMLSLPFNLGMLWFLGGALQYSHWSLSDELDPYLPIPVSDADTCMRDSADAACSENIWLWDAITASFRGMTAVFFGESLLPGLICYAGMALGNPFGTFVAWAGSLIGVLTGTVMGVDGYQLWGGIWSFNALLTAGAIGSGNFCHVTKSSTALALVGAFLSTCLFGTVAGLLAPAGMPAMSFPFCIATLAILNLHSHTDVVTVDGASAGPRYNPVESAATEAPISSFGMGASMDDGVL